MHLEVDMLDTLLVDIFNWLILQTVLAKKDMEPLDLTSDLMAH